MIKALKGLLGLAHREDATTGEIAPSLPTAEAELGAAWQAQTEAEAAYKAGLLTADDAMLRRLVDARTEAGMRVDRATAILAALRERHAQAEVREAEAQRVIAYEAARDQADDARRTLAEVYPALAGDLVRLLEIVAIAEVEVGRVNADLPKGAERLAGVESSVRDIHGEAGELIDEQVVERWVRVGETLPGNFDQSSIYKTGAGRGVLPVPGVPLNACDEVELRRFTEQRAVAGRLRVAAYGLAERVALPGMRAGDVDLWRPLESPARPNAVLAQLGRLNTRELLPEPIPQVTTRLIAESGAKPVLTHRRPPSFGARGAA